jgi:hypothetical protein
MRNCGGFFDFASMPSFPSDKGIADANLQYEVDGPAFYTMIDRTRAVQLGLNASPIATNLLGRSSNLRKVVAAQKLSLIRRPMRLFV